MPIDPPGTEIAATVDQEPSLTRAAITGGFWTVVNNLALKASGGIKTILLARLLAPEDFGLAGLALVCVGTLNMLSSPGVITALIQKKELDRYDLNVGWWIHAARGCLLFVLVAPLTGWVADFYEEPRLRMMLLAVAFTFLLDGFQSIGIVRLNRKLDFRRLLLMHQVASVAGLIVAVVLAWTLRSAWALVLAHLAQMLVLLVATYVFEPFRPFLPVDWKRARNLLGFGKYISISLVCYFLVVRGVEFILGKMVGLERYGYYTMALSLVGMVSAPVDQLITTVAFPALSRLQNEADRLRAAFAQVFRTAMVISVPLFVGTAIFGRDVVGLSLQHEWRPVVQILVWLCLFGWFRSMVQCFDVLQTAIGRPHVQTMIRVIELGLFVLAIIPAIQRYGVWGAAACLFSIQVVSFLINLMVTSRHIPGTATTIGKIWVSFLPLFAVQILFGWLQWRWVSVSWPRFAFLGGAYAVLVAAFLLWRERPLLETILRGGQARRAP
ncbi:MAG: lipopolysaccharide biosynthesis protein [Acidobacteriota bacterium]